MSEVKKRPHLVKEYTVADLTEIIKYLEYALEIKPRDADLKRRLNVYKAELQARGKA